jgi:hypothetical protein
VFILVPFDFPRNGHVRKTEIAQAFVDNGCHADRGRNDSLDMFTALNGAAAKTTPERDLNDDPELNYKLMWTWFLPNPLWENQSDANKWIGHRNSPFNDL